MQRPAPTPRPDDDPVRPRRLQTDAARAIDVNLAEAIELSHKLLRIAGSAEDEEAAGRPRDLVDLDDLDAAHGDG